MSEPERAMDQQIWAAGIEAPVLEHRFAPPRRWRFDKCWPDRRVALEIEGGLWHQGRHQRPKGYEADCRKYSEAALLGWRVLRVTPAMVASGEALALLQRAMATKEEETA